MTSNVEVGFQVALIGSHSLMIHCNKVIAIQFPNLCPCYFTVIAKSSFDNQLYCSAPIYFLVIYEFTAY